MNFRGEHESYRPKIVNEDGSDYTPVAATLKRSGKKGERDALQTRKAFIKTSVVSEAAGSAYVEFGRTKVICSVFGPRTKQQGRTEFKNEGTIACSFRYAPFAKPDQGRSDNRQTADEKLASEMIRRSIISSIQVHKFPKSTLEVIVLVLEDDGSALSVAVNCASLALVDSGVELYDIVSSCTVAVLPEGGKKNKGRIIVDPTTEEEHLADALIQVAMMHSLENITELTITGNIDFNLTGEATGICIDGCKAVYEVQKEQLLRCANE